MQDKKKYKKTSENLKYEINTFLIAKAYQFRFGEDWVRAPIPKNDYNATLQKYLVNTFLEKGVFLTEELAVKKFGTIAKNYPLSKGLFNVSDSKGESVYINPYQIVIIEKENKYFSFFFAIRLMQCYISSEINHFPEFLDFQLKINFHNNINDFRKFINTILRKYASTIFHEIKDFIKEEFENKYPVLVLKDDNKIKCDATYIQFRKFFNILITTATEGVNENDIEPFIRNNFKLKGKEKPSIKLKSDFKIKCKKDHKTIVVALFWLLIFYYNKIFKEDIIKIKTLLKEVFGIGHDTIENFFRKKKIREKVLSQLPFSLIKIQLNILFQNLRHV